ncbi:hypothetical protein NP233_g10468 [Leucocoprinus birnbaumii]|uniref:Uncharacterized protein n=1 Tax=Leucocoprinus birnbaumii TaxID=56174 RepID=A0AAD5VI80_9AGAR|nr:hypothetical protein NP233_g10468 [Leucocoprinus birnbaumii]
MVAPANPAQVVEHVVNYVAGLDFYSPLPLTPSLPGSWEQVLSHTRVLPSSAQHSDLSASSPIGSDLRSQNCFEVLAPLLDHEPVGSTVPTDDVPIVDDHIIFAINPLDEHNKQLSPELLDVVNQAAASLSDEQRDNYRCRYPETPGNAQAGMSQDKGKGTNPRNWGVAGIPNQELDADTHSKKRGHKKSSKKSKGKGKCKHGCCKHSPSPSNSSSDSSSSEDDPDSDHGSNSSSDNSSSLSSDSGSSTTSSTSTAALDGFDNLDSDSESSSSSDSNAGYPSH